MVDYKKRLTEVVEILNQLPKEEYEKIPTNVIKGIENEKDKEYLWKYDTSKALSMQNLSRDTVAILSYINMEYLLNDEQKQYMKELHKYNEQKNHSMEAENINYDFNYTKTNKEKNEEVSYDFNYTNVDNIKSENNSIALKPKISFFSKIMDYINKNVIRRKAK